MKKIIALFFLINTFKLYAYDYQWPVDYVVDNDNIDEINKIVQDFIYDNPEFHVYKVDYTVYKNTNTYKLGVRDENYKLLVEKKETAPFGDTLDCKIYLSDVDAVAFFFIPHIPGTGHNLIRLVSYCNDFKQIDENASSKKCKKWVAYTGFNDVEPTKKEAPIKESFERNFLSKLPLSVEYIKPAAIDRGLSKFLSFFRKRKNFPDD